MNESELIKFRRALFPEIRGTKHPAATDPVAVAWAFKGIPMTTGQEPRKRCYNRYGRSPGVKLILLAVAELQAQGILGIPKNVHEQFGIGAFNTTRSKLRYLTADWMKTNQPGWDFSYMPLARAKYKRTFHYYLVEPPK